MSEQDKRTCNIVCVTSLVLLLVPIVFGIGGSVISSLLSTGNNVLSNLSGSLSMVLGASPITGLILMIIARVKFPQSKFAKVVMWIYIVIAILVVIATTIFIIIMAIFCSECAVEIASCSKAMGSMG